MAINTGVARFTHPHEKWIPMPDATSFVQNRSERTIEIIVTDSGEPPIPRQEGVLLEHLEKFETIPEGAVVYVKAQINKALAIVVMYGDFNCGCPTISAPVDPVDPEDPVDTSIFFNGARIGA